MKGNGMKGRRKSNAVVLMYTLAFFSGSGLIGLYLSQYGTDVTSRVLIGTLVTLFVFSTGTLTAKSSLGD